LYIEGTGVIAYNSEGELPDLLGCVAGEFGNPAATGNVRSLRGVKGTLAGDLSFGYRYREMPDNYVEALEPSMPGDTVDYLGGLPCAAMLLSQDGRPRAVCHASGRVRTICSSVIFGALRGTKEDRVKLARACAGFLCGGR
jgi:hypothetical protein